ncbi:MAG: cobalamin-binding protein [Armatimonadetes bacterium]|nr:cobalamin-binding protein [Armatimonadota bacterium]
MLGKLKLATIFVIATLICQSSFAAGYPLKLRDARGKQIVIKARPTRIVSLAPNITEILYALGAGNQVVGVTKYCNYPPEAAKKAKVGDMRTSAEAVLALRPDLVLGHAFVNDAIIARLESLHKTVFAMDPKTIEQTVKDIKSIGIIVGQPKKADAIIKKMQAEMAVVKAQRAKKKPKSVLMVIQANPLWAAGPNTFVDEMLKIANAKNVARDARLGFVPFSKELAISRNPDVIIVGARADKDFFLTSPAWKTTRASKTGHVVVINPDLLVRPGPRLAEGLKAIVKSLN